MEKKINEPKKEGGGVPELKKIGILIFLPIRSPYKILEHYNNPFWSFEQWYRFCVVIFWFHLVIFRSLVIIFRFFAVIFRFRVVIFRFCVVIFPKKCNENSGLPKLLRWSHALRSDQNVPKIVANFVSASR